MNVQVSDRPERHRYEILVEGQLAGFAAYRPVTQHRLAFTHTEIDERYEHRGLGSELVAEVMKDAGRRGIEVLPDCPFVQNYLVEHPDIDVVPADERARYGLNSVGGDQPDQPPV